MWIRNLRYAADRPNGGRGKDTSADLAEEMAGYTDAAFREDQTIIEAQQESLCASRPMSLLTMNQRRNPFRGIVRELMAATTATTGDAETARAG
jgi:hypothetical protein